MAKYPMKFDLPHRGLTWLQYYNAHKVYHPGVDLNFGIGNEDIGEPIYAPIASEVEYVSPAPTVANRYNGGLGWFVVLYHPAYGKWSRYAHLKQVEVKSGQKVAEGHKIGECGNSGTTYAHLHWEVWQPSMYTIQKKHWRKFAYYPSGKSKQYVMEHFLDPMEWIDSLEESQTDKDWCVKHLKNVDWDAIEGIHKDLPTAFRGLAIQVKKWFT